VVAGAAIARTSALVYNKVKNYEPKVVKKFRANLKIYIDAIRNGNMDIDKINYLMSSLDKLNADKNYSKICIQLTSEEIEVLVGRIYEYTLKLARDNEIEVTEEDLGNEKDAIINLQSYLKLQRRIFDEAA
jgi:hypothetical protein